MLLPDPVWPVALLAVIQFVDGILCIGPVKFVAECFEDVNFPRKFWWIMPPIKFAAVVGLFAGIWVPYLGAVTCAALVVYFLTAIAMHLTAHDFGRNLYLNATGMLLVCLATSVFSFVI